MDRLDHLLAKIDPRGRGIEVAPYFNPALPKRDGHDVLVLDVFDTAKLRALAADDPMIPQDRLWEIEEVDLVGDASRIGEIVAEQGLAGTFQHVVSSHNFEHLPDPIRFLQGVEQALAPGGVLSMAVPDCRTCFDHFRYPTRLSDWLAAYHEARRQPTPETIFDALTNRAYHHGRNGTQPGCSVHDDPDGYRAERTLTEVHADYLQRKADGGGSYRDCHVSVFFPETLELMLRDLRALGLIRLEIETITPTFGFEFFVHLRKGDGAAVAADADFFDRRQALLCKIADGIGRAPYRMVERPTRARRVLRRLAGGLRRLGLARRAGP